MAAIDTGAAEQGAAQIDTVITPFLCVALLKTTSVSVDTALAS